jgi:protein translocase SecG subunit
MSILITFLTLVLVVNCLFLILLVLIQLPKKEAGAGLAFGAGATDALFGAGSGNALTKLTKYTAGLFLVLSLVIGLLNSRNAHANFSTLRQKLAVQKANPAPATAVAPTKAANQFQPITNELNVSVPPPSATTNVAVPLTVTTNVTPAATTNK